MKINREFPVEELDQTNFKENALLNNKIIVTGTLVHFSRKGIESTIVALGGIVASSISSSLDFLVYGENAGSKLAKAKSIGIETLSEEEFIKKISK